MKYTEKQIAEARHILDQAGFLVGSLWHTEDIREAGKANIGVELNEEQIQKVKEKLHVDMDANMAITMALIAERIAEVLAKE